MNKNRLLKLICCLLALCCCLSVFAVADPETVSELPAIVGVTEDTDEYYLVDYEEVASNKHNVLYADLEKGHFALKNRQSGEIWYSTPKDVLIDETTIGAERWATYSQLLVEYLYTEDILSAEAVSSTSSQLGALESGSIKVKKIENGIRVEYYFGDLKVTVPVEYYLSGESLVANIPIGEIDESDECLLTSITLLPYFGAGSAAERGQLLIPDGCGALVDFNNGADSKVYRSPVYGEDMVVIEELDSSKTETVRLPVFATLKGDDALMGVITAGDGSASIRAVNGNESRGYNAVSSVCELRNLEQMIMFKRSGSRRNIANLTNFPKGAKDYTVVYTPVSGEKATYVGVAEKYRAYLETEKGLAPKDMNPSVALDIYGAIDVKAAFLGIEYKKLKALTTFDQAEKILSALEEKGIENVATRYLGWSNYGLLNKKLPVKADALSKLGGNRKFARLTENNNLLYADVDFLQYRAGNGKKAVTNIFGEVAKHTERLRSVFATRLGLDPVKLLSPQYIRPTAEKYLESLKKRGIESVSLSTLGEMCYSNSSKKIGFHRYFFPSEIEKTLKLFKDNEISIALESANAFAAVYADRIYEAPTLCSGYDMFDREIPFYQIVFHGLIPMTTAPMAASQDSKVNLLKAAESGSELLWGAMYEDSSVLTGTRYEHLYSTQYNLWLDGAAEKIIRYQSLLDRVHDKKIIAHTEMAPNVMKTTFEGGTEVIVNYGENGATVDGLNIPALDYVYREGGEK